MLKINLPTGWILPSESVNNCQLFWKRSFALLLASPGEWGDGGGGGRLLKISIIGADHSHFWEIKLLFTILKYSD